MSLKEEKESIKREYGLFHPMSQDELLQRDQVSQNSIDEDDLVSQEDARLYFSKKDIE